MVDILLLISVFFCTLFYDNNYDLPVILERLNPPKNNLIIGWTKQTLNVLSAWSALLIMQFSEVKLASTCAQTSTGSQNSRDFNIFKNPALVNIMTYFIISKVKMKQWQSSGAENVQNAYMFRTFRVLVHSIYKNLVKGTIFKSTWDQSQINVLTCNSLARPIQRCKQCSFVTFK